jgi:hypothetical protein
MPSSWLATGAGAADGLEKLLARLRAEELLNEQKRSNRADEDFRNRQLQEQTATRNDTLRLNEQYRRDTLEQRGLESLDKQHAALGPGDRVKAPTKSAMVDRGYPETLFENIKTLESKQTGGYMSPDRAEGAAKTDASLPESTDEFLFEGTAAQRFNQQKEDNDLFTALHSKTSDKAPHVETVKYHGGPVDASWDPDTLRYTYRGKDITDEVDHYEKPPAPDRVLIQSGDSYIPRPVATDRFNRGENIPLPTTSSTRTMSEGAKMLQPKIEAAQQDAIELDKQGLFGPVMSRVRQALTQAGTIDQFTQAISSDPELSKDRLVGRFATRLGLLATGAGRVHGGARGGGSPQMYAHFKEMLGDASSLQMFLGRLDAVDDFMGTYAEGPNADHTTETPSTGGGTGRVYYDADGNPVRK